MRFVVLSLLAWLWVTPVVAQSEVDVELVLMVDVSRSMSENEREIQRRGYAEALRSDEVIAAITGGLLGRAALSYVEWAGNGAQSVIVEWRILGSAEDAHAFANALSVDPDPSLRRTSISSAIAFATRHIETNDIAGLRQVIDISGDGPNNSGGPVTVARDMAVARGIVINGLPLMTSEGRGAQFDLDDLDLYYRDCVVGGPGAFVIPVRRWEEFAPAIRRKIVLELAGHTPDQDPPVRIWHAQAPYDCLIGEKIWERARRMWSLP